MNKRSGFLHFVAGLGMTLVLGGCNKPPEAVAVLPADTSTMGNITDIAVTEQVKTALQLNDALKGFDITVTTTKGDVRLSGMVDTRSQADAAIQIARATQGAHAIHDELTIKK